MPTNQQEKEALDEDGGLTERQWIVARKPGSGLGSERLVAGLRQVKGGSLSPTALLIFMSVDSIIIVWQAKAGPRGAWQVAKESLAPVVLQTVLPAVQRVAASTAASVASAADRAARVTATSAERAECAERARGPTAAVSARWKAQTDGSKIRFISGGCAGGGSGGRGECSGGERPSALLAAENAHLEQTEGCPTTPLEQRPLPTATGWVSGASAGSFLDGFSEGERGAASYLPPQASYPVTATPNAGAGSCAQVAGYAPFDPAPDVANVPGGSTGGVAGASVLVAIRAVGRANAEDEVSKSLACSDLSGGLQSEFDEVYRHAMVQFKGRGCRPGTFSTNRCGFYLDIGRITPGSLSTHKAFCFIVRQHRARGL